MHLRRNPHVVLKFHIFLCFTFCLLLIPSISSFHQRSIDGQKSNCHGKKIPNLCFLTQEKFYKNFPMVFCGYHLCSSIVNLQNVKYCTDTE